MANDENNFNRKKQFWNRSKRRCQFFLYVIILALAVIGASYLILSKAYTIRELIQVLLESAVGVFCAFLIFDIVNNWLTQDIYTEEISQKILDTLRLHPDTLEIYSDRQKREYLSSVAKSIFNDSDVNEYICYFLNTNLYSKEDLLSNNLSEACSRIRTSFQYSFIITTKRTSNFSKLVSPGGENDPYVYISETISFNVKYLTIKGNFTSQKVIKIGLVYNDESLDKFLRGIGDNKIADVLKDCIFREHLNIEEADKQFLSSLKDKPDELKDLIVGMFSPYLKIDHEICVLDSVEIGSIDGIEYGLVLKFIGNHNCSAMEQHIDISFVMPQKWDEVLEVAIVEPTKSPIILMDYDQDDMMLEMFSFLNRHKTSSYSNAAQDASGKFELSLDNEWITPFSGVVFHIKKKLSQGGRMKTYSLRIKFGLMVKNLYFEASDDLETEERWEKACRSLDDVGDACKTDSEFIEKATAHFEKCGFLRIAK